MLGRRYHTWIFKCNVDSEVGSETGEGRAYLAVRILQRMLLFRASPVISSHTGPSLLIVSVMADRKE